MIPVSKEDKILNYNGKIEKKGKKRKIITSWRFGIKVSVAISTWTM